MLAFLFARVDSPKVIDELEGNLRLRVKEYLTFHPRKLSWRRDSCSCAFVLESSHPIWPGGCTNFQEDSASVWNGVPLVTDLKSGNPYSPADLDRHLVRTTVSGFRSTAAGSYATIQQDKKRLVGFTDICGRYPLFYQQVGGCTFVSNQARLIGLASPFSKGFILNRRATTSLCVHSQIWGRDTLYDDVKLLSPSRAIVVEESGVRFPDLSNGVWEWSDDSPPPDLLHYSEAVESARDSMKVLGSLLPNGFRLGLSGGKDSRVVAAACHSAGITSQIEFFTGGLDESPEFEIAERVARVLGTSTRCQISSPSSFEADEYYQRLQYQIGRYDGMMLPISGQSWPANGVTRIEITGFGGELYRGGIAKQFTRKPISNLSDASERWVSYHVPPDINKIILQQVVESDAEWMREWVRRSYKSGSALGALPEQFFAEFRVPLHQGIDVSQSSSRLCIDPLISPAIARAHFRFGQFSGRHELTHAVLTHSFSPEAASQQFMKDRWSEAVTKYLPEKILSEPFAQGVKDSKIRPVAWKFFERLPQTLKAILVPKDSPLYDYVSRLELERLVSKGFAFSSTPQANQLFTIFGLQMRLAGKHLVPRDGTRYRVQVCADESEARPWKEWLRNEGYILDFETDTHEDEHRKYTIQKGFQITSVKPGREEDWWQQERTGRWMKSTQASFKIFVPQNASALRIRGRFFGPIREVSVSSAESCLSVSGDIQGRDGLLVEVPQVLLGREIEFSIRLSGGPGYSPMAIGHSKDQRTLTCMVTSLEFLTLSPDL